MVLSHYHFKFAYRFQFLGLQTGCTDWCSGRYPESFKRNAGICHDRFLPYPSHWSSRTILPCYSIYDGVSKSFWTGRLERELQMVRLSATKCSCIVILWVSLVSFAAITLCVYCLFRYDSVRELLGIPL